MPSGSVGWVERSEPHHVLSKFSWWGSLRSTHPTVRSKAMVFVVALLSLTATIAAEPLPPLVPVAGDATSGRFVEIDAQGRFHFDAAGKPVVLAPTDLVKWGTCVEPARGPLIVLADGGLVTAEILGADKDHLSAESDLWGSLKLPLESLSAVVFRWPASNAQRDRLLQRIARAKGESDRLWLDNGDEINGLVEGLQNDKVAIKADSGPLEIDSRRIVALVFSPALKQKPARQGLRCWVGLSDGSRLAATRLTLADSMLELTAAGTTWKAAAKELVFLQPVGGRAVYLSDREPAEYKHVPYLDLAWPYAVDRSVGGGLLRCGGHLYLKGLGVHSAARLSYKLDGRAQRFQAELGIDDATAGRGSVQFRVLVDDQQKFASGPVRGGERPRSITVDLGGGTRLDLLVDFGERGDQQGHADWLDARLVP